jgi:hypothetical protein
VSQAEHLAARQHAAAHLAHIHRLRYRHAHFEFVAFRRVGAVIEADLATVHIWPGVRVYFVEVLRHFVILPPKTYARDEHVIDRLYINIF